MPHPTHPYLHLCILFLLASLQTACTQTPPPTTTPQKNSDTTVFPDTVWLDNDTIKLGVAPSVGRITWFSFANEDNLLWINPDTHPPHQTTKPAATKPGQPTWANHGGDIVWPFPQPLWKFFSTHGSHWPPDDQLGGQPWELLEHTDTRIVLRSPISNISGIQITRTLTTTPDSNTLLIRNQIHRQRPSALPAQAWSITQIKHPDEVRLHAAGNRNRADGDWLALDEGEKFGDEVQRHPDHITWTPKGQPAYKKLGTTGQWLAARFGQTTFTQQHHYAPDAAYPENTNLQLYVAGPYCELETLSPMMPLFPGQSLVHDVRWTLEKNTEKH